MTTSLDAYRSDREKLLARVRELEAEVERLTTDLALAKLRPFIVLDECPRCTTRRLDGEEQASEHIPYIDTYFGLTRPRFCSTWFRKLLCSFRTKMTIEQWRRPHFHQRCTACGARWVVDAEGWRFD